MCGSLYAVGIFRRHGSFSSQEGFAQGHGVQFPHGWQPESCVGNMGSLVSKSREPGLWGWKLEHPN